MTTNTLQPTHQSVDEFLSTVSDKRQQESRVLIDMMRDISGCEPAMWGASIIGFGTYHYVYESGREGDMGAIGFSPRKASLTIYISDGFDAYADELSRLGKHKTSVSCLYINTLADVDLSALREIVTRSYQQLMSGRGIKHETTVDSYVAAIPAQARPLFDELRAVARRTLPEAKEVISYGIIGYKVDAKRPVVFISGWKDHVAVYPIPHEPLVRKACAAYIKGKGTLWFSLGEPLPTTLIQNVIKAHLAAHMKRQKK